MQIQYTLAQEASPARASGTPSAVPGATAGGGPSHGPTQTHHFPTLQQNPVEGPPLLPWCFADALSSVESFADPQGIRSCGELL